MKFFEDILRGFRKRPDSRFGSLRHASHTSPKQSKFEKHYGERMNRRMSGLDYQLRERRLTAIDSVKRLKREERAYRRRRLRQTIQEAKG